MNIFTDPVRQDAAQDPAPAAFHVTDVADRIHAIAIKVNSCYKRLLLKIKKKHRQCFEICNAPLRNKN